MSVSAEQAAKLEKAAKRLRYDIVMMIGAGKPGHLGGSCRSPRSLPYCTSQDAAQPPGSEVAGQRQILLSKGHAALAQYAALAESGYFPKKELQT